MKELGFDAVVAVNRFPADSQFELEAVSALALEHGAFGVAVNDGYEHARSWSERPGRARRRGGGSERAGPVLYELDDPIETKLDALARRVYGGTGVDLSPVARATLERLPPSCTGFRSASRRPTCPFRTTRS